MRSAELGWRNWGLSGLRILKSPCIPAVVEKFIGVLAQNGCDRLLLVEGFVILRFRNAVADEITKVGGTAICHLSFIHPV